MPASDHIRGRHGTEAVHIGRPVIQQNTHPLQGLHPDPVPRPCACMTCTPPHEH